MDRARLQPEAAERRPFQVEKHPAAGRADFEVLVAPTGDPAARVKVPDCRPEAIRRHDGDTIAYPGKGVRVGFEDPSERGSNPTEAPGARKGQRQVGRGVEEAGSLEAGQHGARAG
jgi:hypothetical protein